MAQLPELAPETNLNSGKNVDELTPEKELRGIIRAQTESLLHTECGREFTCTDGQKTGYRLSNRNPTHSDGEYQLELMAADGTRLVKGFLISVPAHAPKIVEAFAKLEDTPAMADQIRRLIQKVPGSLVMWARTGGNQDIWSISSEETTMPVPKQFDWSPYEGYNRTFPLADGEQVTVTTELDKQRSYVIFQLKKPNDSVLYCCPINTIEAGMVLAALEELLQNENAGGILLQGMQDHKNLIDILNMDMMDCYRTQPPTLTYREDVSSR